MPPYFSGFPFPLRDKTELDIFWLKDDSMDAALEAFRAAEEALANNETIWSKLNPILRKPPFKKTDPASWKQWQA